MKSHPAITELKLATFMKHAPVGLAEIDDQGKIIHLNLAGETLLKPVLIANDMAGDNLYPVLEQIAPAIAGKIKESAGETGDLMVNELQSFHLVFGGEKIERHFNFTVTRLIPECTLVSFDDVTEKCQRDKAILGFVLDKAVIQGKYEIASNVLHDIGNAIVGIGSYITRIRRVLENSSADNLKNLAGFFATQENSLVTAFGEQKAGAVITLLSSITESQINNLEELKKSIKEQTNIITHIQEILAIQRQYLTGNESQARESTDIRSLVNDCMSMLLASIEKRGITVSLNVPSGLPVILTNRTKLMQVMLNLLKNSMEAIDLTAEEKKISIHAHADADWLTLTIQDNGHGFDKETGQKLFTRGFTTKASGTGLGLSHCRSIMENHGGTVDISSEGFGKGALITIKFKIHTTK